MYLEFVCNQANERQKVDKFRDLALVQQTIDQRGQVRKHFGAEASNEARKGESCCVPDSFKLTECL